MKRDMELVREILLVLEASDEFNVPMKELDAALPTRDQREIVWHLGLMQQAGLITLEEEINTTFDGTEHFIDSARLSWSGYDFLAEAANPQIWEAAKKRAGEAFYSLSIGTLQALLGAAARQVIGLP